VLSLFSKIFANFQVSLLPSTDFMSDLSRISMPLQAIQVNIFCRDCDFNIFVSDLQPAGYSSYHYYAAAAQQGHFYYSPGEGLHWPTTTGETKPETILQEKVTWELQLPLDRLSLPSL
jgi:hypothetical protein